MELLKSEMKQWLQLKRAIDKTANGKIWNFGKHMSTKYNLEDINVQDLENGKVHVFAVSDDFINMKSPSIDEGNIDEKALPVVRKKLAKAPKASKVASKNKMKLPSGLVNYMDFTENIIEKLTKKNDVGDFVNDFKKSDAKQFKGKSNKKKAEMAVAAHLSKQND